MHKSIYRKSFTLIELLVVIAIIAILAGMLLPALNRARMTAQSAGCMNNMKQVALVFNSYIDDYKGRYPVHNMFGQSWGWGMSRAKGKADKQRLGYADQKVFRCPTIASKLSADTLDKGHAIGMAYNYFLLSGADVPAKHPKEIRQDRCTQPSKQFILLESNRSNSQVYAWYSATQEAQARPSHGARKLNILYADWHVEPFLVSNPLNAYGSVWPSANKEAPKGFLGNCNWSTQMNGNLDTKLGWCKFK